MINNKRGAVSTYRFLAMYLLIGIIIGAITQIGINDTDSSKGYDVSGGMQGRVGEIGNQKDTLIQQGDNLVKANSLTLTSGWGNENSMGRNVVEVLYRGFLPTGLIPTGYKASQLEQSLNWVL